MRSTSFAFSLAAWAFCIGSAACGGGSEPAPRPLTTKFDEMHLAQIAPEAKPAVVATQNEYQLARMTNEKAKADLAEMNVMLDVASNEYKQSKLTVDSAISQKKAAEVSNEVNRINDATKEQRAAELSSRAANERVNYMKAVRAYRQVAQLVTEEDMYYKEAKFELAKADVAQSNGIQPAKPAFVHADFAKQELDRRAKVSRRQTAAQAAKSKAEAARAKWLSMQQEADALSGRTGALPDPMAQ